MIECRLRTKHLSYSHEDAPAWCSRCGVGCMAYALCVRVPSVSQGMKAFYFHTGAKIRGLGMKRLEWIGLEKQVEGEG